MQSLKDRPAYILQSLLATRVCALAIALLVMSVYSSYASAKLSLLAYNNRYSVLIFFFAFTAISCLWYLFRGASKRFLVLQLFVDVILASILVYFSGATKSPFLFLYITLVFTSTLLLGFRFAIYIIAASLLGFIAAQLSLYSQSSSWTVIFVKPDFIIETVALVLGMLAAALAPRVLRKHVLLSEQAVFNSEALIENIKSQQMGLLNQMPYAIVATNEQGFLIHLNSKAESLFKISRELVLGQKFDEIFKLSPAPDFGVETEGQGSGLQKVKVKGLSEELICDVYNKPIDIDKNSKAGQLYIFEIRDLSTSQSFNGGILDLISSQFSHKKEPVELLPGFVATSLLMNKVFGLIRKVSRTDAAVLITGESGTGKELVASSIHKLSERTAEKFIAVNCAAIPEHLLEAEFFGHKKGAFTGAYQDRVGLFEQANGGTIFLDEIGELPLQLQSKLLRVLQEKTFRPIGSNIEQSLDIRVLSATNKNLYKEVSKGNFREDLYYRLNVVTIALPPLRERKEDIPILIECILKKLGLEAESLSLNTQDLNLLLSYDYPGNIRELENIIERALVFGEGQFNFDLLNLQNSTKSEQVETKIITLDDLNFPVKLDDLLNDLEKSYIEHALQDTNGNKSKAADLLGLSMRSFRYRLDKYSIS